MRVAAGLAGAHAISGSWRTVSFQTVSDNGITTTFKTGGNVLTMTTPTGQKYTAKMDGTEAPISGRPGAHHGLREKDGRQRDPGTGRRGGEVSGIQTMTVSADGKKMHVVH